MKTVRPLRQLFFITLSYGFLWSGLKTTHQFRAATLEDSGSLSACAYVCASVCVCVRQCVTSRKLLSADLHYALFPLGEKQASFVSQGEGKVRQTAVQYDKEKVTCGYNKSAEVLNKELCHHTAITICKVSHIKWKNTKSL